MSLQTLPNNILLGILQRVSSWTNYHEVDFKQQLKVLAVFQRLRTIALPKIYSHVYIIFGDGGCKSRSYSNKYSKTFSTDIDTNADIIALASCTRMVTSAKINVYDLSETYVELHNTIEALQYCAESWPNITKLEMTLDHNNDSDISSDSQLVQPCRVGKEHCQKVASTMPSVTEFLPSNGSGSPDINEFYSQVIDAYSGQLVKLDADELDHIDRKKLNVLQYLHLQLGDHMKLPRVNCRTLVDLRIYRITDNVLWAPFMDSKDDTVLEFPCLKRLELGFIYDEDSKHTDSNMPELQLKFPVLDSLTISYYAEVCPFFKMAVLPNDLKAVSEKTQRVTLAHLHTPGMPYGTKIIMRRS